MTNKTEALARLTQLEAEATALRKVLEAPEPAPSLLPAQYEQGWRMDGSYGNFRVASFADVPTGENYFATQQQAQDYADAFSTLILLRRQPGTEKPVDDKCQYAIQTREGGSVSPTRLDLYVNKAGRISPSFATWADAEQAIQVVGAARIRKMMETFHHID